MYTDADNDSAFSAGDLPLAGVSVSLYRDLDRDGVPDPEELLGSTLTDTAGEYAFSGLPEGDYLVVETDPTGYVSVTDIDGPANGTNVIAVTLAGSDRTGQNFLDEPAPPTAALLARFEATWGAGTVVLSWDTLVEIETLGFYVERSTTGYAWERVGTELVPATGQNRLPQSYRYTDTAAPEHPELRYRLVEVELNGRRQVLAETAASVRLTAALVLTPAGWRLAVSGVPSATVRVETATAVNGPWVPIQTLTLDPRGRGRVNLGAPGFEAARFFRLGLD
ncbi:MAG: SpaA isopeptide-forming pilin-related protein [Verrucomicrobia bacterium]|nr:SpaA isopeptide-forming pilin-related protein [Verrucomicrobiota bacterium]